MQISRTEERKVQSDYSALGILCLVLSGFVVFAWLPFMMQQVSQPIVMGGFMSISGVVGALGFGLFGIGLRLMKR